MNAFEAGTRKVIPAVLVYVVDPGSASVLPSVLMIHRNAPDRPGDYHAGKWNGLGGKLELDESPLEAAQRELREESGLELPAEAFKPRGMIQFPNFKAHKNEDWVVFLFVAAAPGASAGWPVWGGRGRWSPAGEGELHWVPQSEVMGLSLWPGDREFLPQVLAGEAVLGTVWYQGTEVVRAWIVDV